MELDPIISSEHVSVLLVPDTDMSNAEYPDVSLFWMKLILEFGLMKCWCYCENVEYRIHESRQVA